MKKHFEGIEFHGDPLLPLREYSVREILAVYILGTFGETGEPLEPDLYRVVPDLEAETGEGPEDTVYSLSLSPALNRGLSAVKAVYRAGYGCGEAPADLASACLELAAWNTSRYRGRRIGMTGNVRGSGKDGEHLEASMPENVRLLLEPYRRREKRTDCPADPKSDLEQVFLEQCHDFSSERMASKLGTRLGIQIPLYTCFLSLVTDIDVAGSISVQLAIMLHGCLLSITDI
jgi:hypothetical protein